MATVMKGSVRDTTRYESYQTEKGHPSDITRYLFSHGIHMVSYMEDMRVLERHSESAIRTSRRIAAREPQEKLTLSLNNRIALPVQTYVVAIRCSKRLTGDTMSRFTASLSILPLTIRSGR